MAEERKLTKEEIAKERVSTFKAVTDGMIANSQNGYRTYDYGSTSLSGIVTYTDEEIAEIISGGSQDQLSALSRSYFRASGFYRRIILFYAYLLLYAHVLVPHYKKKINANSKTYYNQALDFMDHLNIKNFCAQAAAAVLIDGIYYGIFTEKKDKVSIAKLPISYCRSNYNGYSELPIVEFDLAYFNTLLTKEQQERAFAIFPPDVKKTYNKYLDGKANRWYIIPEGQGVCFKMEEARPMFINTITAIENFETYRDLEVQKEELETKKILVQEIGVKSDGEFVIEPEEALELHRGAVSMLSNNTSLDVLTTYAEAKVLSLSDARQTVSSNLDSFEKMIYSESGASSNIFAATGNLSLAQSLNNDLSLMMTLANQISNTFTYLMNKKFETSSISFSITILPISYYNIDEYMDQQYKLATTGYSFILPALASGLSQKQFFDIKTLENDVLSLKDMLIPLSTAFTESAEGRIRKPNAGEDGIDGGAPEKDQTKKSDKTIKNIEGGKNS